MTIRRNWFKALLTPFLSCLICRAAGRMHSAQLPGPGNAMPGTLSLRVSIIDLPGGSLSLSCLSLSLCLSLSYLSLSFLSVSPTVSLSLSLYFDPGPSAAWADLARPALIATREWPGSLALPGHWGLRFYVAGKSRPGG